MKAPVVRTFSSTENIADHFANILYRAVVSAGTWHMVSVALSGGSTPRAIYSYLASLKGNLLAWHRIRLFWGDERCVVPESPESNYRMAKESLLDHISIPESGIFRIKGEREPLSEADSYAETVSGLLPHENHIPRFDIVMLGLGEDGHTVSIFPDNILLFHSDKLFEATENPYSGQQRITATGKLINQAAMVVFIVTGRSKAGIAASVIEKRGDWEKYPASLVQPVNGELLWLLDEEAASELGK